MKKLISNIYRFLVDHKILKQKINLFKSKHHERYFLCSDAMDALFDNKITRDEYDFYEWYLWEVQFKL